MRLIYSKPVLNDLSQGSRIAFIRQFRKMSQDEVSDKLGITGECKRRTITRYEKGNRNPKEDRTKDISRILNINYKAIKKYDFTKISDVIYFLMWLEELIPNYVIDISRIPKVDESNIAKLKQLINVWNNMRIKRIKREITYDDYIEWKFNEFLSEEEI